MQSFTGGHQALVVIPWESYFSIVNTLPRADYPPALPVSFNLLIISAKAYWEQFWVDLNLSKLYSGEPLRIQFHSAALWTGALMLFFGC